MRSFVPCCCVFAATLLATAAQAAEPDPAPAATTAAPAPGPADDKTICRTGPSTGSMIPPRKTCRTRRQWANHDEAGRAAAQALRDEAGGRPAGN